MFLIVHCAFFALWDKSRVRAGLFRMLAAGDFLSCSAKSSTRASNKTTQIHGRSWLTLLNNQCALLTPAHLKVLSPIVGVERAQRSLLMLPLLDLVGVSLVF